MIGVYFFDFEGYVVGIVLVLINGIDLYVVYF